MISGAPGPVDLSPPRGHEASPGAPTSRGVLAHWAPLGAVAVLGAAEGGAALGATPAHFAAVGATLVGIAIVLQGWRWVRREVGEQIAVAIADHGKDDEIRHGRIEAQIARLADRLEHRCRCKE